MKTKMKSLEEIVMAISSNLVRIECPRNQLSPSLGSSMSWIPYPARRAASPLPRFGSVMMLQIKGLKTCVIQTNHIENLDLALIRAGRMDLKVIFHLLRFRKKIEVVYLLRSNTVSQRLPKSRNYSEFSFL
jgi:hypothetical protein